MKKSVVAIAVLGAISGAAYADGSVSVYGVVDVGLASTSNVKNTTSASGSVIGMQSGGMQTSRWGFKGTQDLGDNLKANFMLESELIPGSGTTLGATDTNSGTTTSTSLFKRGAWVGLQSDIGEMRLGRQNTANYDYVSKYDAMKGGNIGALVIYTDSSTATAGSGNSFTTYGVDRYNNAVQLRSADMGGFNVRAGYSFGGYTASSSAGSIYDIGAEYKIGGFQIAAAYLSVNAAVVNTTTTPIQAVQATTNYGIYALYDAGFATFNFDHVDTKGKQSAAGASYKVDAIGARIPVGEKTTVIAQYAMANNSQTNAKPKELSGGVQYDVSKTYALYGLFAMAKQDNLSSLNTASTTKFSNAGGLGTAPVAGSNQTSVMFGMNYKF